MDISLYTEEVVDPEDATMLAKLAQHKTSGLTF